MAARIGHRLRKVNGRGQAYSSAMAEARASGTDVRRGLPSVDEVLRQDWARALEERYGRAPLLRHLRALLDEARAEATRPDESALEGTVAALPGRLSRRLEAGAAPSLVTVINATGVVIHTNLGRAPLSEEAAARVAKVASAYSNLEFDLDAGERGNREVHAEERLQKLLGAEGTVVVNNNAAAVLLAVNTIAEGREVLVSRGELVEIGGSFRIPDVLKKGGARLREVGTTNRTRLADYRAALGPDTALILKVHPSNFRIVGFTESPPRKELATLARSAGIPLVEDLGSGLLAPRPDLAGEHTVAESLEAGVDLVTFSGDKLLGGPQAGLAAGRKAIADAMRRNPLYRAVRVDKMTLAALDAVLADHETGRAAERVPVQRMLGLDAGRVRARARALADALRAECPQAQVEVVDGSSAVGGGAAPTLEIPTALLAVTHAVLGADRLAAALRRADPPVVARIAGDRVVLDLRTVQENEEEPLRRCLVRVLK
jgi:L-seryl-tRNA(Ser) seleniumtransferase